MKRLLTIAGCCLAVCWATGAWATVEMPDRRFGDGTVAHGDRDNLSAMGPGKLVLASDVKDEKSLRRLYDRMHRLRVDYVVVPPHLRNAGNVSFGQARASRTLGADEVPGIAACERFLDFSERAKRTRGRELAHAIAAAAPIMVLACDPAVYLKDAAFKLVKGLPTAYDETRVLADGVLARRAGKDWYLAFENVCEKDKTVEVDLSFLGKGEKRLFAFIGKDGVQNRKVRTDEKLSFAVGKDDGFALRLTPPVTLFFAGDSTLAPRRAWHPAGSWGEHLAPYLRDEVRIVNGAWGGRSSKSLRGLGHWDEEIAPYIGEGDWVLLQFGTNDAVKNQPYRSCTPYEYSTKGRYRLVIAPSDWGNDPKLRPAWAVIRQGGNYNNGGTTWAFPDVPMFPEARLHQSALTGDNFARIVTD